MDNDVFDVIQIGNGPVGLLMAAHMGRLGHRIAVIERHSHLYNLPRAGHIDHEVVRSLQAAGVASTVMADAYECNQYVWKNGKDEVLLEFPWGSDSDSGWHSDYMAYQPVMEDALYSRNVDDPNVTAYRGWEAIDFVDQGDHVEVTIARTRPTGDAGMLEVTDEVITLRAGYLIGADGARSAVRERLGIQRSDLGFNERWLDIDVRRHRDFELDFDMGQICDPARPAFIAPLGKRHRRFEWSLLPGETVEEMTRPEVAWKLLGELGVTSDDVSIVRQQVYTFEARMAEEWRRGRVVLIGDAAHTMPPHMGQGMCSGLRDANNLAWKLDLILRGLADDTLLDTYQPEREPHVMGWTIISIEAGKVSCTLDPAIADERDAAFRRGEFPPIPDNPVLTTGILHRNPDGGIRLPVGGLSPQAHVEHRGVNGLLDDIVGGGRWALIRDDSVTLSDRSTALLATLGAVDVEIGDGLDAFRDIDGRYGAYLAENGWNAVLVRPDFYVFGGSVAADIDALLDDLSAQLGLQGADATPATVVA